MAASCAQFYRDEVYIRSVLCTTGEGRGNTGEQGRVSRRAVSFSRWLGRLRRRTADKTKGQGEGGLENAANEGNGLATLPFGLLSSPYHPDRKNNQESASPRNTSILYRRVTIFERFSRIFLEKISSRERDIYIYNLISNKVMLLRKNNINFSRYVNVNFCRIFSLFF